MILPAVNEPLTRSEKLRLGINLAIRLGSFGYFTYWFISHLDETPSWGIALYAFIALVLLFQPLLLLAGWIYFRWRGIKI